MASGNDIILPNETGRNTTDIHLMELSQGWSGLSSYVNLDNPSIESLFLPVQDQLIILYNQTGVFIPEQQVNTIGDWNPQSGYIAKFNQETTLEFSGLKIQNGALSLTVGWNLIPVLSDCPVNVETLFANTDLQVVKEVAGLKLFWPGFAINTINELLPGNAYYVMMNSPAEISFPDCGGAQWQCGDPLIDPRDGQSYATLQVGDQCWMAENLNIGTLINGTSIQGNNGIIEKYCFGNSEANCIEYGGLYQWNEMMGYTIIPGAQGICPDGWHVPTDAEWISFTSYVSSQFAFRCNSNSTFIAKSLAATTNWLTSLNTCVIGNNLSINNATSFTALPGGFRHTDGSFYAQNRYAYWWTSSQNDASNAWYWHMYYDSAIVSRNLINKAFGSSVRCLKNN